MMEMVVTTGAIRRANRHHQQTNTQLFYRLDALPVAQQTVPKHPLSLSVLTAIFQVNLG